MSVDILAADWEDRQWTSAKVYNYNTVRYYIMCKFYDNERKCIACRPTIIAACIAAITGER